MRKYFFIFCFVLLADASYALSPLPRNSYLRLGDNQKEVKILQQILNSDPDTMVDKTGVGSPGRENWYFGVMTERALKRFQEKNNLEVTGRIDFKTWKKLNDYVLGVTPTPDPPSKGGSNADTNSISGKIQSADEKRLSINEQNKKDFEAAKKLKAEKAEEEAETKKEESKSYIQSLLDKYTGFFYTSKGDAEKDTQKTGLSTTANTTPTQDTYSNNYSAQTPYQNPNTGIYSSNPNYASQPSQPTTNNNLAGQPGLNPFLPQQQNPYINYGQQPFSQSAPTPMNQSTFNGVVGGALPGKFKILPDGWLAGPTTHFGSEWNGSRDAAPGSNCTAAMNNNINICNPATCIASLPIAAQVYFWGNAQQKSIIGGILGQSANSQYKALGWSYNPIKGSPIEILNPATGKCTVAPIWETGPGDSEGGAIDLTPCIKKVIGPSTNFISHFRPVPAGKRGCEGYQFIPSLVK